MALQSVQNCERPHSMDIKPGNLDDARLIALLHAHLITARAASAPGSAHALDLSGLRSPAISLWTVWEDGILIGVGALKRLCDDHGEVKSMHTSQGMRRKGVGQLMLRHLIAEARTCGMRRLSLETGSSEYFLPARTLYVRHGFVEVPPFADYLLDPNSVFMSLELGPVAPSCL
jgi:putative acetyltransferase